MTSQTEHGLTGFPSIDKPWMKYYGEEALRRPLPEGTMYEYMTSCNADRMDAVALNYFGKKVTHRQMQEKIDVCARALLADGVRAGDTVSLKAGKKYIVSRISESGAREENGFAEG